MEKKVQLLLKTFMKLEHTEYQFQQFYKMALRSGMTRLYLIFIRYYHPCTVKLLVRTTVLRKSIIATRGTHFIRILIMPNKSDPIRCTILYGNDLGRLSNWCYDSLLRAPSSEYQFENSSKEHEQPQ